MNPVEKIRHIFNSPNRTVTAMGSRPWAQRLSKVLTAGFAVVALYGAALTPTNIFSGDHQSLNSRVTLAEILKQPGLVSPVPGGDFLQRLTETAPKDLSQSAKIEVTPDMTNKQIAAKLLEQGHHFQALAVTLESLETRPYRDGCGLNVGMGYCINARIREHGVEHVRNDLLSAGIQSSNVDVLLGKNAKAQSQVELTKTQALSLLSITEEGYMTRVRDIVGPKVFDNLKPNEKGVLGWLGYNTGDALGKFNQLLMAVRQNNKAEAVKHMTPFFAQQGKMVPNARAGSWLMAAYWSEDAMKNAIANPDALEFNSRRGKSPIEVVAPQEARVLASKNILPESPYVFHAEKQEASSTPTYQAAVPSKEVAAPKQNQYVRSSSPAPAPVSESALSAPDENGVRWRQVTIPNPNRVAQQPSNTDADIERWEARRRASQPEQRAEVSPPPAPRFGR